MGAPVMTEYFKNKKAAVLASRIKASEKKLATLDDRIGYLMTQRADEQDRLAALLQEAQGVCEVVTDKQACPLHAEGE